MSTPEPPAPEPAASVPPPPAPSASVPQDPVPPVPAPPAPSAPEPSAPEHGSNTKKWLRLGAVVVAVGVVGLKLAAGFGIGFAADKVKHRNDDAEAVVQSFMQANTAGDITSTLATGVKSKNITDAACMNTFTTDTSTKFEITGSHNADDGSATVDAKLDESGQKLTFTLVDQSGWKIKSFSCQ